MRSIEGVSELLASSGLELRSLLEELADRGRAQVAEEAAAQGVRVITGVRAATGDEAVDGLTKALRRLVDNPHVDALRAVTERAVLIPPNQSLEAALGMIDQEGNRLSEKPLERLAQSSGHGAMGIGRSYATDEEGNEPAQIYASELLDENTCSPCLRVDGRNYPSMAAMREDYPLGMYRLCAGGMLCRGTPVYVWRSEEQSQA